MAKKPAKKTPATKPARAAGAQRAAKQEPMTRKKGEQSKRFPASPPEGSSMPGNRVLDKPLSDRRCPRLGCGGPVEIGTERDDDGNIFVWRCILCGWRRYKQASENVHKPTSLPAQSLAHQPRKRAEENSTNAKKPLPSASALMTLSADDLDRAVARHFQWALIHGIEAQTQHNLILAHSPVAMDPPHILGTIRYKPLTSQPWLTIAKEDFDRNNPNRNSVEGLIDGTLQISLDLTTSHEEMEQFVRDAVRRYKKLLGMPSDQRRKPHRVDPWKVWDLRHGKGMNFEDIARTLGNFKGHTTYDQKAKRWYDRVSRAYQAAEEMLACVDRLLPRQK